MKRKAVALSGAEASAEAMKQINPDVVAAYPITPQTLIMDTYAKFIADGDVDSEMILVESEHSAMSACVGSSAAGARTMTATAANGLALMFEIVYIAASNRLPIVMNVVNRALSGPINIHCDHSDSMACRDSSWIQFYSENAQEAYDNTIMAMKVAENKNILLPAMVCQDGFITSHAVERVDILDKKTVQKFIGPFTGGHHPLLDVDNPVTSGPLDFFDYYFEHKRQQLDAMDNAKKVIPKVFEEFTKLTGTKYDFFEGYMLDDADMAIVVLNSSAGTAKHVVNQLRAEGKRVGVLKVRVFRPFMHDKIVELLRNVKAVAVLDRSASFGGFGGPVFNEVRSSFHEVRDYRPNIINYIYGLGGRELTVDLVKQVYAELEKVKTGEIGERVRYLGVR
ncbi:MAG: transketolase C-terminal domain-containing protein [archaeon]